MTTKMASLELTNKFIKRLECNESYKKYYNCAFT